MLTINSVFILRKSVNYRASVNLFSNWNINSASMTCRVSPQTADGGRLVQGPVDCVDRCPPGSGVTVGVTGQARAANVCLACRLPPRRPLAITDMSQSCCQQPPSGHDRPAHSRLCGGLTAAKARRRPNSAGLWWRSREVQTRERRADGADVRWLNGRRRAASRHAGSACCDRLPALVHASHQSLLYQALQPTHTDTVTWIHPQQ